MKNSGTFGKGILALLLSIFTAIVSLFNPGIKLPGDQPKQYVGYSYDKQDEVYYTVNNAWQRYFGYTSNYDMLAEMLVMYFDTNRIHFQYEKKDWMVQFWKGQYGLIFMGAEIGVYNKGLKEKVDFYKCVDDDERLRIGYVCYSFNKELNKYEILFTRTSQDTWWLTGFVPGKLDDFSNPGQLCMKINIKFKDAGMKDAFVKGLKDANCGFKYGNAANPAKQADRDTYFVQNDMVYILWCTDRGEETMPKDSSV